MELYIGGFAQGKLQYVLQQTGMTLEQVTEAKELTEQVVLLNHFHRWVKNRLKEGDTPEVLTSRMEEMLLRNPKMIVISDEVGNGIIPMDAGERYYREVLGRLLCVLAERAEKVERIICGIGQKIK